MAEKFLLQPDKGAVAVFAPTGLGHISEHDILTQKVFGAIFNDGKSILGEATTQAKIGSYTNGASGDMVETFVLFGDPAVELKGLSDGGGGGKGKFAPHILLLLL